MIGQPFQVFVTPPRFPSCVREYGTVGPLDFVGDGSENKFPALFFATFRNLLILLAAERTPPIRIFHAHQRVATSVPAAAVRRASVLICARLKAGHPQARRRGHPVLFLAKFQVWHFSHPFRLFNPTVFGVLPLPAASSSLVSTRKGKNVDQNGRSSSPGFVRFGRSVPFSLSLASHLSTRWFSIATDRPFVSSVACVPWSTVMIEAFTIASTKLR